MKKLYTLALAAAVTLSASAGMFERTAKTVEATFAGEYQKAVSHKSMRKAPAKVDATLPKIEGDYIYTYEMSGSTWMEPITIEKQDDGTYLIKGMLNPFTNTLCDDIPATFSLVDWQFSDGTYPLPTFTIKGQGQTKAFTYNGYDYGLWIGDSGQNQLYGDDVEFIFINGEFLWPFGVNIGIGFIREVEGKYGGIIGSNPNILAANATMTYYEYDDAYEQTEENICKVNAKQDADELTITGMCDMPCPITFTLDYAKQTATAVEQTAMILSQDGEIYDFVCCNGDDDPEITATFTTGDKPSVLTITEDFWWAYAAGVGYWAAFSGGEIRLPFAIEDPAGVSNIKVDNSNAPVEYFNLQGVRVQNPANGLFIRRQGNTATKVLVK